MYYNYNGKIISINEAIIHPDNRSFRYGEGLFETIRLQNNQLPLWNAHWNRLITSLPQLYFSAPAHFNSDVLKIQVLALAQKNKCTDAARVRITVCKGEGGLWETPSTSFNYIIQCWPIENKEFSMNENGLDIGLFEDGWKSCDAFSNLKSNNYQLYALAAQFAKQQKWNEALVLNQHQRICDATIANVFFLKDNVLHTPHLKEGGVNGVMRNYLIAQLHSANVQIVEGAYSVTDLLHADELFLTNAMYGIRWVKLFGQKSYSFQQAAHFFHTHLLPLFK
ncbi:MAG: aminotransferase class IV [Chitinophagaceae bacterium]|jgi:branched-chain amino acid aminotransferase|nr:aminotransferase class IV [Chitinophagaceae bacterium]